MATQAGLALSLYESNPQITCGEFVTEFALAFPSLPPKTAALYWQNKARRAKFGLPPTALPSEYKGIVEAKAPKATKEVSPRKALKDAGLKATVKRKAKEAIADSKSPDEIAKIKAANLARLKEVSSKKKVYSNVARGDGPGVDNFDADEARADVAGVISDLESFKAPKFLTKSQVKALV
jgi:hypothetical protein